MKTPTSIAAVAALFAVLGVAQPVMAAHPPKPRITLAAARAHALRLAPGKVISSEYENEDGGWRYSFDIQQKNNVQEIGIDAMTGKVVENKSEGKHDRE